MWSPLVTGEQEKNNFILENKKPEQMFWFFVFTKFQIN
jgi:hypothetical protein